MAVGYIAASNSTVHLSSVHYWVPENREFHLAPGEKFVG